MRLLITGGCGFIGSNFIHYWLAHHPEDHILNLDVLTYAGNLENLKDSDPARYAYVYGDICNPDIVRRTMDGIDAVVHFAAESHVDHSIRNCQKFLMTNVMGTYTLLEEVRRRGAQIKHFHHISTDEVFGSLELNAQEKFDETTPYDPKNPYSVSKAASDHLCRAFRHTYHLPITISNCTNNYGPYQFPEKLIPRMIIQALTDQVLTIHGDGLQVRDWIHVEDHARGIEAILRKRSAGETFCFGGNAERSVIEVARHVLDVLGKPHSLLSFVEDRVGNDRRYAMDWKKASHHLGWRPQRNFDEGLRQTVEWYRRNEAWWRPLLEKGAMQEYASRNLLAQPVRALPTVASQSPSTSSSMHILIFGQGYVAERMAASWPDSVSVNVRIDDKDAVLRAIDEHKPDAVVNAAGKAGNPTTDWCETHPLETFRSNTVGPLILAEACQARGVYLVQLATGCIFFGPPPDPQGWREEDHANPDPVYARSKYAADLILKDLPNTAVVRFRMPIDHTPHPRNLIDKLAKYASVPDVENSASILDDVVAVVRQLIQKRATGIFHATNPGPMRHHELLRLYREYVDPQHTFEKIRDADLLARGLTKSKRSNCILQSHRLEALGIRMRPMDIALRETMQAYAAHVRKTSPAHAPATQPQAAAAFPPLHPSSDKHELRGVILAGGGNSGPNGSSAIHKHLTPVFDRPLIMYPLQTLLEAGINRIMIVTDAEQAGPMIRLLDSGEERKAHITYRIQKEPRGIAHALSLAAEFVDGHACAVILGDNIFEDSFQPAVKQFTGGATIFYAPSEHANEYGVVEVDPWGNVRSIEERPSQPKSRFAQVGLYLYDHDVFEMIKNLPPSERGELEITDINNRYLAQGKLQARPLTNAWWDAGTFHGLAQAIQRFSQKAGVL